MALATCNAEGQPSVRIVLLKGVEDGRFTFFTSYESRKAAELEANPRAALNFSWLELERQVNVIGEVTRSSREASEAYFKMRPRGNQLGAWASHQSAVIGDRGELERNLAEFDAKYPGDTVPLPPFWGGYVLTPIEVEIWQGRSNRLHDRFRYSRQSGGKWRIERLSP